MADEAPYVVTELRRRPGRLWECLVVMPDGATRRLVVPDAIASVHGLAISASAVATLYAEQQARRASTTRPGPTSEVVQWRRRGRSQSRTP